jgi:putative colanic acid biosynthesis acetyltransferase WcaF
MASAQRLPWLRDAKSTNRTRDRSRLAECAWYLIEWLLVTNALQPSSAVRRWVLRAFGARIGEQVIIRPRVRVKYPWKLTIENDCWIGEAVWIHNQEKVTIHHDSVISQDSLITTGSHDLNSMDLLVAPITIGPHAWVTARCIVLKGSHIGRGTVITAGSVVRGDLLDHSVYGGNPAIFIRNR